MTMIESIIKDIRDKQIVLYGLGTETERFIKDYGQRTNIIGLLDGFRTTGEMYGYPIITIEQAIQQNTALVLVIARPGSCKVIAKRIGDICREHKISLLDIRGRDLLLQNTVRFDFPEITGETKDSLQKKISQADIISFDLFDTLLTRKVYAYTDIFELVDHELKSSGIYIADFPAHRLAVEKDLSKNGAPTLEEIYEEVLRRTGGNFITAKELSELEWTLDSSTMLLREDVYQVFHDTIKTGKRIFITTDSYYRRNQIESLLSRFHIEGYEDILVSCEYATSKTLGLFDELYKKSSGRILHIGDDLTADIEAAQRRGFDTFRLYSGAELLDTLGGMKIEETISSFSDRIKVGLFLSRIFNSPFWFEKDHMKVSVQSAEDIGYLFCAPLITDFVLWLQKELSKQNYSQVLFGARDGYLIGKLYRKLDSKTKSIYFLTSRTAAIRAGIKTKEDIDYVFNMKFSGSEEDALITRFGIHPSELSGQDRTEYLLKKAKENRRNYTKYIDKINIDDDKIAFFDFVAKGTTQLYLRNLFSQPLKGFYFLQLEPEYMTNKALDIEPFYSNKEKDTSAIFDNYYILETILTSPYPQLVSFDPDGMPMFLNRSRSPEAIRCFSNVQSGIEKYFIDYLTLTPEDLRAENKSLDERLLSLLSKVSIENNDFLALNVEDPFFGRTTDIKDVLS